MAEGVDLSKTLTGGSEEQFNVCCSPCSEDEIYTEVEKCCIDCEMYFCGKCLKYHKPIPFSRGHKIVDKSQAEAGSTKASLPPTKRSLTHHGTLQDMYCADHDVVCCGACVAVTHRTCIKVYYLPDVARGIKESQEFNDVKDMLHSVHCELEREKTKRKDNLSSQGRKTLEEDIKTITSAITKISLHEENISSGNEAEIFVKVKYGKIAVKDCRKLLADLSRRSNLNISRFFANEKQHSNVNESKRIGTVSILEEQRNKIDLKIKAEEQMTDSSNIEVKEEKTDEKLNVEVGEEVKKDPEVLRYTATFSGKYKVNEIPCEVTSACILNNTSLMLFDNTHCFLKRLSMVDFKIIDKLKLQWLSYSICSVGPEEVAVAFWFIRKIQLVSVGRTMRLTRSFSTDYYCRGVAFNEVSGEFYVISFSNTVMLYDKNGKLMKTYDRDGEGSSMFSGTYNVAWSEDRAVLYVTDWTKGLIALSMSGDLMWTFSDSDLKYTQGLCVLPGDVILVSGVNSNNVIQVDKRGKKIGTLLCAKDNLNRPYALAYDRNTSRLIVCRNSNDILVYNLAKK